MRSCVLISALLACPILSAQTPAAPAAALAAAATTAFVNGTVADESGAIIPGAQVVITDATGKTIASATTDAAGTFRVPVQVSGIYTLSVTLAGFQPYSAGVSVEGNKSPAAMKVTLAVATSVQQVEVNAGSQTDLTATENNGDTSTMSAKDIKDLPVFDNDLVTAMGSFLDAGQAGTAGSGLMVDGVEANRAMVSPSAIQEVHINQDAYSAQYYNPGRGQMEIITKQSTDTYHGQFNFTFRDAALNAQQGFSPTKPPEQRRIYEGNLTGPVAHLKNTMFLFSMNRAEEDLTSVTNATVAPTPDNPSGVYNVNTPSPTRDTEFSIRVGHQFSDKNSASLMYAFQDATNRNSGVGNQTLPEAGYDTETREDDLIFHNDYIISASKLNQFSLVAERTYFPMSDVQEGPRLVVNGNYVGGSAQTDQVASEYNVRGSDIVTWTQGPHNLKFGVNLPHLSRRVFDDNTNRAGTYTYSPTYAADGSVIATSIQNEQAGNPSGYTAKEGQIRFVYHQQETGAFVQDQIKLTHRFSLTPGLRYDWQNFLSSDVNNFSPRLSFAYVIDQKHEMVLRGGGGVYYDRIGSSPTLDIARYEHAELRLFQISSNQQSLCYPIADCVTADTLAPSLVERAPGIKTPYQINYGISLDRKVGQSGTISIGGRMNRGVDLFRSIDINAPLPPDYATRPDVAISQYRQIQSASTQNGSALDINYRGRLNRYFTGFAWYTWSHYGNDTSGISWFPQNQQDPKAEWGPADWDQRNHFGFYGMFNPEHLLNLGVGVFANSGKPWTILTGTDAYGDNLFNARPEGVARNSEIGPDYADLDLRWGYDFKLQPKETDKSPTIGVSVSSFDVLNHLNGSYVDTTQGSEDFGQVTSALPPRRVQLAMRLNF